MAVKISTIMPVYNTSEYLREAIESVLNQTLKDIELICVDDGSTDNSVEIIEEYQRKDPRVKLIKQENLHAGVARNNGLKIATGEYVHFLDSDDWLDITAYERLYDRVKDTKEDICQFFFYRYDNITGICTSQTNYFSGYTEPEECVCANFSEEPEHFIYNYVEPWNKIYRRQFLIDGGFKFSSQQVANDWSFYFDVITKAESVKTYNALLIYHRVNITGQLTRNFSETHIDCLYNGMQEILKLCEHLPIKNYNMVVDNCMGDIFWILSKASGKQKIKMWQRLSEHFARLDLPYCEYSGRKNFFSWYENYLAIKEPLKPEERVIISLTSYPPRIPTVSKCIETLMIQSLRVEKIILWLANEQFPNGEADLPEDLLELKDYTFEDGTKFEIRWCEDIRSYKKLIPLLREDSDAVIITVDDDKHYELDMVKRLYLSYLEFPDSVHAHWVANVFMYVSDNCLEMGSKYYPNAHALNMPIGCGGVLYPKNCFYKDITNAELFMKLAPENDDVWFWCMANLNGYFVRPVKNGIRALSIEGTQEVGLFHKNNAPGGLLYIQSKNIMDYYPQWREMLENACPANIAKVQYAGTIHSELRNLRKELCKLKSNFQSAVCEEVGLSAEEKDDSFYESLSPAEYKRAIKGQVMSETGQELNFAHPANFSEKIQLLKLTDSTPLKGKLADKYAVRQYVAERIGEEYLVPLLGVYDSFDQIDFASLPQKFALKCNHGCGYNIIVQDKADLELEGVKTQVEEWLNTNFAYRYGLQLHYSYIQPKIIIEQFMENEGGDLYGYKFACFNGKVKFIWVDTGRYTNHRRTLFDTNWNVLPFELQYPIDEVTPQKPQNLEKMTELAEKLAQGFSFVRVDFYLLNDGSIKFGEMNFTSGSGTDRFEPQYYDRVVGEMLEIK